MRYSSIDPVISTWAQRHGLVLPMRDQSGNDLDFRNAYTSADEAECCQIWIDPPEQGMVSVHMASVESRDDRETREDWCVPLSDLEAALEAALSSAITWMKREV